MRGLSLTWGQMWFKSQCGFSRHHSFNVVHCTMLPIVQKHTNVSYTITRVMVFNTHSRAKDCNYRQRGLKIHKALVGRSETFWARVLIGPGAWPLLILALGIWVLLHLTIVAKVVSHSHGTWSVADISQADIKGSCWSRISRGSDWSQRLEGSQQRPIVRRINVWVTMIVRRRGGKPRWLSHWTSCTYSPWKVKYIQVE